MLIGMASNKEGGRQNFTVILDQDEMATLVSNLQRNDIRPKSITHFIDRVNDLWRVHNGMPIVEPPEEQKLLEGPESD